MRSSFKLKEDVKQYIKEFSWPWKLSWRPEQLDVITSFLTYQYEEIIVQAIFGGGKTTMMLAIISIMCLQNMSFIDDIFICAFNIGIKNEIKKKLRKIGKFNVKTFDSLIYHCCDLLDYKDLKLLNFEAKRRFVKENLDRLPPNKDVKFVFVDESQDLEKTCYSILRHYFPNAKFMFVGDVFQSIQKEPRESMLWFLLHRAESPSFKTFRMIDTPRVPTPILLEMKDALVQYYPEFTSTIHQWKSSSTLPTKAKISWIPFKSYSSVYQNILDRLQTLDHTKTMILTFSSAITVRGSLGDIARFRRFFSSKGISINLNHKRMQDDRLFLTTANSSKGLERENVICILTFPLELAFCNFSNDLVMNLITVALSRCKDNVTFFVPVHLDRFSKVLQCFSRCPSPIENSIKKTMDNKKLIQANKDVNAFEYDPTDLVGMLQKEHSVTEVLRQGIISFETRQLLMRLAKNETNWELSTTAVEQFKTEEECTLAGLIFESLILSLWMGRFPTASFSDIQHHSVFSEQVGKISSMVKTYNKYIKTHPITNEKSRFCGCFLYAQVHLFAFQKIYIRCDKTKNAILYKKWLSILPYIKKIPISQGSNFKTQVNVAMPFLKGIVDAAKIISNKAATEEKMDIYEIKASRSSDWKQNALLQAILYGVLSAKAFFNVYLVNVFSKQAKLYKIFLKKDLMWIRNRVVQEILNWNMNCYLAKNVRHDVMKPNAQKIHIHQSIFVDGRFDVLQNKWTEFSLCEFISQTKTRLTILIDQPSTILEETENKPLPLLEQFEKELDKYRKVYGITKIYGCPEICKFSLKGIIPFVCKKPMYKSESKLDEGCSYNSLALLVCGLVESQEYQLVE